MEPLLIASSLLFGREVVAQTISGSAKNILSGVSSIIDDEDFVFTQILNKCDLISKVEIINSYVQELHEDASDFNESTKIALKHIEDILKKIENEIDEIKKQIKTHQELWFHRFRTPSYKNLLDNLLIHIKVLDDRFNLLIKIKN
mgnify:CR=1 FL=1|jgi:peptidoglycan hydrolase CwlO-like protein